MDYQQMGNQIQKIRKRKGLTQEKLAELADLSVPYISHIERATKKPSLGTLLKIAAALDVTANELLYGLQPADRTAYYQETQQLLDECSMLERRILLEVVTSVRKGMQEYKKNLMGCA